MLTVMEDLLFKNVSEVKEYMKFHEENQYVILMWNLKLNEKNY